MSREWRFYLADILDACDKVISYSRGMTRQDFLADSRTYDAVVRNLEIIGEAARQVPADVREGLSIIPWSRIAGMRNLLAHAYFGIDDSILWDVVRNHVPPLREAVKNYLDADAQHDAGV